MSDQTRTCSDKHQFWSENDVRLQALLGYIKMVSYTVNNVGIRTLKVLTVTLSLTTSDKEAIKFYMYA